MKTIITLILISAFSASVNAITLHCVRSNKVHSTLIAKQTEQGLIVERYFKDQSVYGPQLAKPLTIDDPFQYEIIGGSIKEYMNLTQGALEESNLARRAGLSIGKHLENFYECIRRY